MRKLIVITGTFALALAATAAGHPAAARDWDNSDRGAQRQWAPAQNTRPTGNRQRSDRDNSTRGAPKNYRDQTMQDWSVHYNEQHPFVGPD